jgi:hypothetical protein
MGQEAEEADLEPEEAAVEEAAEVAEQQELQN